MMNRLIVIGVFIGTLFIVIHSANSYRKMEETSGPLYLTPYIERGDITAGRKAAETQSLLSDNTVSYSGYITVNKAYNSNMFFWFFPAEKDSDNAPVIVWLHGGPGLSSVFGVFEIGPYNLDSNKTLSKRKIRWTQNYNVLFVDNPVGTGFSYTEQDEGYSKTHTDIGENLYNTVQQFYKLFPHLRANELYLAGSSYAGKYIPAFSYVINQKQKQENENNKLNLKGLIMGNAFCDPATIINRSQILYQTGLIDINFKKQLDTYIQNMVALIKEEKYEEALGINTVMRKEITEKTGFTSLLNFLHDSDEPVYDRITEYINTTEMTNKLNVGNRPFKTNDKLFVFIRNELLQSVKPLIEELLENYRVLMYSGHLDIEIPYPLNAEFLRSLNWSGNEGFNKAERKHWRINDKLVGYYTTESKLCEVMVRNAGHNAAVDKPATVLSMIDSFINNKSDNCVMN